jgi:hypothetical protein
MDSRFITLVILSEFKVNTIKDEEIRVKQLLKKKSKLYGNSGNSKARLVTLVTYDVVDDQKHILRNKEVVLKRKNLNQKS